ncbi:MAG: hypothetical protein AAFR95_08325 [Bacteroidota bacterium]
MSQGARRTILVLFTATVALALHVILGWAWSVLGAVLGGFVMGRGGSVVGALGLVLPWSALVLWNLAFFGPEMARMTEAVGSLLGGLPSFVVPLLTLVSAFVLGTLGGLTGASLRKQLLPQQDATTAA